MKILAHAFAFAFALSAGFGCSKKADGPPCERLATALCGSDTTNCEAFIAAENKGETKEKADGWCKSIVDDPSAVKVFKDEASNFKAKPE